MAFKKAYASVLFQNHLYSLNTPSSLIANRTFCTKQNKEELKKEKEEKKAEETKEEKNTSSGEDTTTSEDSDEEVTLKAKEIKKLLKDQDDEIEDLKKKLENAKKQYQYQLAENDNTVKRYKEEVSKTKEYSIAKFAKDLLEVRDNLQMAIDHAKKSNIEEIADLEECKTNFKNLFDGVSMTSTVFDKTMKRFKVEEFNPEGEKFNPSFHEAMFMVDDDKKEPNTVAVVMQTGWKIGDRVLRAAKVG